jgi:hypothetical protein
MVVREELAVVRDTGARFNGVKTKIGVNTCFRALWGGSKYYFSENSSDLGHYFLPSSPEKSPFTL